eukprot:TRINITY_DN3411_c0_g1_i4.p2 TRINITY_DN3411_c0_g1~~TRINITY_DN3411_c0_g1_i4.p2  ORF type:complete len:293 (-),score=39.74 TRINITY_DN3411_c0_g1_i4:562-1440(-)
MVRVTGRNGGYRHVQPPEIHSPVRHLKNENPRKQRGRSRQRQNGARSELQQTVRVRFDGFGGSTLYLQQFPAAIAPILHTFDLEGIQEMFGSADFIAISSYASLKPDFKTPELQSAMYQFDEELKVFNVSIRELFENNGLEFHFAEYGIGGGTAQRGFKKAANEAEVAEFPFFGIYGAYNNQTDPWSMWSDQLTPARRYLHYFYNKTVEMLSADITVNYTASNSQYRTEYVYPVDGLYIWNLASWDVQAIYPDSTTQDGSYRDEYVAQLIRNHNQEMKYRRVTTDVSGARSL